MGTLMLDYVLVKEMNRCRTKSLRFVGIRIVNKECLFSYILSMSDGMFGFKDDWL